MTTFNLFKFSAQYCCSVSTFVFINNFALLINQSRTHEFHCARKADILFMFHAAVSLNLGQFKKSYQKGIELFIKKRCQKKEAETEFMYNKSNSIFSTVLINLSLLVGFGVQITKYGR